MAIELCNSGGLGTIPHHTSKLFILPTFLKLPPQLHNTKSMWHTRHDFLHS
ncbi:hypothetical protein A2U01_0062470, partial [Trifolium medium]|nr:hypothetical protein [Trifolium medium]